MSVNDIINGSFEILGGLLNIFNIRQLLIDKQIKGISWPVVGFFTSWGLWNLFYYPSLHQYVSFIGGVTLVITNLIWLVLALRYKKNPGGN
jgi:hypothetical protein